MRAQKELIFYRYRPTWMQMGVEKPLKNDQPQRFLNKPQACTDASAALGA
jgi:hypothetical protein